MAKETFSYNDLKRALAGKQFSPVYLFHGEEEFLVDEAAQSVINAALTLDERGFNLDILYGNEADAREIASHASSFPMMAERRVVLVREVDKLSNKELLAQYMENASPTTSLILLSSKPDFRRKPYLTAKKHGVVVEFKPLRENELPGWIGGRVQKQGKEILPEASKMLAAYVGSSLREVQNEIDKLYVFIGEKKTVAADDIRMVVGVSKEYNIFELQNAVGAKNLKRSVEIIERMLAAGESAVWMIVMLTRYFTVLWKLFDLRRRHVPAQEQATSVGVHPYFLKEYTQALDLYSSPEVETAFEIIATADEQLKSTGMDEKVVMQTMLIRLMRQGEVDVRSVSREHSVAG